VILARFGEVDLDSLVRGRRSFRTVRADQGTVFDLSQVLGSVMSSNLCAERSNSPAPEFQPKNEIKSACLAGSTGMMRIGE
jgi:hypothetical protein